MSTPALELASPDAPGGDPLRAFLFLGDGEPRYATANPALLGRRLSLAHRVASDLIAAYLLHRAGAETTYQNQIARDLEVVALRDRWDEKAWHDAYTFLLHLTRPGGPLLGGDPALAAACRTCCTHLLVQGGTA